MESPPSNRVVHHRTCQKSFRIVCVEVQVPIEDAALFKAAAKALKNPQRATRARTLLREIAASPAPTLKTLLTTGPDFEDLNLDRAQDLGRVSEW
ncbi:MAG: hypothetical protein VW701_13255 [Deltaproteobacteria bacterium]